MVAAILHGSLVFDDFMPGRSDLDLLVVVDRPLADAERAALEAMGATVCVEGEHPIDIRVVTRAAASRPARVPEMELYVGCHGGIEIQARSLEPDLLVELSAARTHGRSLIGPEARSVAGVVPARWITEYGDQLLARWQQLTDDDQHAELMVLTAARIWRFAVEGIHSSKSDAARWALEQDPSLSAVSDALIRRAGGDARIQPAEIERVLGVARLAVARHR